MFRRKSSPHSTDRPSSLDEAIIQREALALPGIHALAPETAHYPGLASTRFRNIKAQLVDSPAIGEVVTATMMLTSDTQEPTYELRFVDGRRYVLWCDHQGNVRSIS